MSDLAIRVICVRQIPPIMGICRNRGGAPQSPQLKEVRENRPPFVTCCRTGLAQSGDDYGHKHARSVPRCNKRRPGHLRRAFFLANGRGRQFFIFGKIRTLCRVARGKLAIHLVHSFDAVSETGQVAAPVLSGNRHSASQFPP